MENSPAELTTLLESRISHFYTHLKVDGPYSDLFSWLFLIMLFVISLFLIMLFVISMMERTPKGKAVATTSAGGGHNGDGDDERKRREAEKKYAIFKIRQTKKGMAGFLRDLTKGDRLFPRAPSLQEWETVTSKVCDDLCSKFYVPPELRRGFLNGLFTQLTIYEREGPHFEKFLNEMIKCLSDNK